MSDAADPRIKATFEAEVWDLVRTIPRGRVTTYGRIATLVGTPAGMAVVAYQAYGARWVGGAMSRSPHGVPWWRVINAQGRISVRDLASEQRRLLEAEGVVFDAHDRVDLARFGWPGDLF
ncbi:methyltransferase [bacterium]|nr:methyltransferase [bacterium]